MLSVGLAPGLTNLMVKRLAAPLEVREEAVIAVRLGLGEQHGDLAVEWTLRQLAASASWSTLTTFDYPGEGSVSAIPIDLADQHVVRRTLGFDRARTLMTLESSAWTRGVALLAPALRRRWLLAGVRRLFPYLRLGRDAWTVAVEVRGVADGHPIRSLLAAEGVSEANGTAAVAARLVQLLEARRRPGVFHVEQLFELEEALDGVDVVLR
ncbi:MAG: hypothetical protein KC468_35705 [Myxococcales bacterium]|nr:hypothetical protein [Myxococcales bacterium]